MNSYELGKLLALLVEQGGSDLHLSIGSPPRLRVDGKLVEIEGPDLTGSDTQGLAESALGGDQLETLKEDLSFPSEEVT